MTIQGTLGQQILLNQTVTLSGSFVYEVDQNQQILLYWNIIGPVTGTLPTIQFTMQGLDPTDTVTPIAQTSSSSIVTNTGTGQLNLAAATSPFMLISWTVGGTTPSFGGANLAVISRPVGSILTSNQGTPNTLANAWTVELTDGTNGPAAVKAASTAAAATDAALAVALSPNSPLPVGTNAIGTVTVTGTNADGTTFTGNPVVAAGVDFNSLAQNISATNLNGSAQLNVIDRQTQDKLDMMILILTDIKNLLLAQNAAFAGGLLSK